MGVFDVPYCVKHELDLVLAVCATGRTAERVVLVRHMKALVQMEHGVVIEEDVAMVAVVDAPAVGHRCG